jgi:hypothetical protein
VQQDIGLAAFSLMKTIVLDSSNLTSDKLAELGWLLEASDFFKPRGSQRQPHVSCTIASRIRSDLKTSAATFKRLTCTCVRSVDPIHNRIRSGETRPGSKVVLAVFP